MEPRAIIVSRPTAYQELIARFGTHNHAAWMLEQQGQSLRQEAIRHRRQKVAESQVERALPDAWRRTRVQRQELDRFLFEPNDIVLAVGQDGLVANVAKYLNGQPVVGINPEPERWEGTLCRYPVEAVADLLSGRHQWQPEQRTMVEAATSDGQMLWAVNEVFIGHSSHQSARYVLKVLGTEERQSSSGIIVSTGTGATGWARSISQSTGRVTELPTPTSSQLAWFVREPWPSRHTGATMQHGLLAADEQAVVVSEMGEGGVVFGDGIESDVLTFTYGTQLTVRRAPVALHLV